ncbi:MAG: S41 family peptidase, partial [Prevotellaceae bacterium]|nr:S41 family peptidase [Prevotellaceae bacterium]
MPTAPKQNGSINPTAKLTALLRVIEEQYVDTVNMQTIVEDAIPAILQELDPHSSYIPAKDLEKVNAELDGSFSGIGIQFMVQEDTIHVSDVIQGGPSEKVGLQAGDRIVTVNDTLFVGKELTSDKAVSKLKGPKGTEVRIGVKRVGEKELLSFTIVRGDIPQNTIDATYMMDERYGYIQISRFGRNTYSELLQALAKLKYARCEGVIVDLRGNVGGYLEAAIRMVNEFLPAGQLIVYTEGVHFPRMSEYATGTGSSQQLPLVVLIDEASASSSEIFAGAIQDNDRGMLVGRRSFGKGLVQQPIQFTDGSEVRLTVSRYYTPSGRCIQRPYMNGKDPEYEMDLYTRYQHGEFFSSDSIKLNTDERYQTRIGRPVYGGGGIMPDIFVPRDTTGTSSYLQKVINNGLVTSFTFQYTDRNRKTLEPYTTMEDLLNYVRQQGLIENFVSYADSRGVKRRNNLIYRSYRHLERNIYGSIIYNMLGMEQYIRYFNQS